VKTEAACSSETLVSTYNTIRFYNPEDRKLNSPRSENLKSRTVKRKTVKQLLRQTRINKFFFLFLHEEEIRNFFSSQYIILMIK
jgi:hypothetical protein